MAKKKQNKSKNKRKKELKKKKASPGTSKETVKLAKKEKKKTAKKSEKKEKKQVASKISSPEKHEIWKKNFILAGIVILLVLLNLGIYLAKHRQKPIPPTRNVTTSAISENSNQNNQPEAQKDETESDKEIQTLLKEQEMGNWKTYQNRVYGFQIKYPDDWPDPTVSGPQNGFKYRAKISFRANQEEGKNSNGFDIDIYRSLRTNAKPKPNYSDNLSLKDSAEPNFENCKSLEIFSIGTAEYPALQVKALSDDPCFKEAYFFSLQKGFNIFDFVPIPGSGIGYSGYDGEKVVGEEFPDFYRILSTFGFRLVRQTSQQTNNPATKPIAKPVQLKVEVPRVSRGIRCPEKIQHPHSSNTKGKHVDEDCCPDPDEYPKAGCAYSAHDYSILKKK